jgi:hypothetical protein
LPQTSAKSRNLILKFKDFFFPSFRWQFLFLVVKQYIESKKNIQKKKL